LIPYYQILKDKSYIHKQTYHSGCDSATAARKKQLKLLLAHQ
jgi:hypothetical protein